MSVHDGKPYITIKNGRIARSGIQFYTKEEIFARGLVPKEDKPVYAEMRPAHVVLGAKDSYRYIPFVNEHTDYDVTPDNFREHMAGMVGGNIGVEAVNDSEDIYLTSDIIFYDRQAYKDYEDGKKELSSSYDANSIAVDFAKYGYDFILQDMPVINHLALCKMARAGHEARILDSVSHDAGNQGNVEEQPMKALKGVLAVLGIGKSKDSTKPFSASVFDSLEKAKTLDEENRNKARDAFVEESINGCFIDSHARSMLAGAVSDSFDDIVGVLAEKEKFTAVVDSLHGKCVDSMKSVIDEGKDGKDGKDVHAEPDADDKGGKSDGDDDNKGGKAKDSADVTVAVAQALKDAMPEIVKQVTSAMSKSVTDSIDSSVKAALGLSDDKKGDDNRGVRDSVTDINIDGLFGVNGSASA